MEGSETARAGEIPSGGPGSPSEVSGGVPGGTGGISDLHDRVVVTADAEAVAQAAARELLAAEARALADHGYFAVALAGGTTPARLYDLLAGPYRSVCDWVRWQVYFSDERGCPPDDPASNFHLAQTRLFSHVGIPAGQIERMRGEAGDLDAEADRYSAVLAATLPLITTLPPTTTVTPTTKIPAPASVATEATIAPASSVVTPASVATPAPNVPRLDCVLLGLGEDGHTASLFPGTSALDVVDCWTTRGLATYEPYERLTLTFPLINGAKTVFVSATGAAKRAALQGVIAGRVPAARLHPSDGELVWLLDTAAAAGI